MTVHKDEAPECASRGVLISTILLVVTLSLTAAGCASGSGGGDPATPPQSPTPSATGGGEAEPGTETDTGSTDPAAFALAERWGVEMVAVRLTAADYMLDVRYKILDPDKAAPLFERTNKAFLVHGPSGLSIKVHSPAKTGPLRPTNPPEEGRIYFTMFSNPQGMVKRGDQVTLKIGEFEAAMEVE